MADLNDLAAAAKQMIEALNEVVAEQAPPLVDAFAIPILLGRVAAPEGIEPVRAPIMALGIEVPAHVYRFPDHMEAQAAWDALIGRFAAAGKTARASAGTGSAFAGPVLTVDTEPVYLNLIDEDPDSQYLRRHKTMMSSDAAALEDLARLTGLRFRYCYGPDMDQAPLPDEPGVINLFASARPPGIHMVRVHVHKLFGKPVWNDNETRIVHCPTYGRGRVIEGEGLPLFQVLGSNYYSLPMVHSQLCNELDRPWQWRRLLDYLARDLTDRSEVESWQESRLDARVQTPEELETGFRRLASRQASEARDKVRRLEAEIDDHQNKMIEKIREADGFRAGLRTLETRAAEIQERLVADVTKLRSRPDVTHIVFSEEEGLHVVTAPIVLTGGGRRYDLGSFRLQIAPEGRIAVWSEAPKHPKGHHHPHVNQSSLACFGNITTALTKLTAAYRFGEAAELVLRWLKNYNPETTLIALEEFPSEPLAAEGDAP